MSIFQWNVSMSIFTRNHRDMRVEGYGTMTTTNENNNIVFLYIFMCWIMTILSMNINPQKEIFHNYDFSVYTAPKYRDLKLDTYRRITPIGPRTPIFGTVYFLTPVYRHISGVYNTRVFFGVISSMKYTSQFKNFTTARMHWHMYGLQWHFESFFHQDTIRSIILFTMYYVTSFYCNKYLCIPTLHGNLKFHNYSIHTIPNTALLGVFHGEPPGATQFTTNINLWQFSLLIPINK